MQITNINKNFQKGNVVEFELEDKLFDSPIPCVVATNNVYNKELDIVQVIPIIKESRENRSIVTNVVIEGSIENGLNKTWVADCLQSRPVSKQNFVRFCGELDRDTIAKIDRAISVVFNL